MKTELRLTLAAIVATLPLMSANAAQTLNLGPNLPAGMVPDGYAGFDWHGAQNDVFADTTATSFGSLFITELSRTAPFDLNSMVVQDLESDAPSIGETSNKRTTISGYLNGTLVETLTENYAFGGGALLTLNMDDVNDVKFTTSDIRTVTGVGTITGGDLTLVSQLTVDNVAAKAPEIDPATAASALTFLIGGLLVVSGRRRMALDLPCLNKSSYRSDPKPIPRAATDTTTRST